jgi:hypothetical protein
VQTITQLPDEELAIFFLRLTFGGSPGPMNGEVFHKAFATLPTSCYLTITGTLISWLLQQAFQQSNFLMMISHLEFDAT